MPCYAVGGACTMSALVADEDCGAVGVGEVFLAGGTSTAGVEAPVEVGNHIDGCPRGILDVS